MANNYLFLKCKRTDTKILIAKYYPSTGWYVPHPETIGHKLNALFHLDDFGSIDWKYAQDEGIKAKGGMFDANAHELVYSEEGK